MQANIYVDGFNLYYRCVKDTPYKWLNILQMCRLMFPHYEMKRLRYFTADVLYNPADPFQLQRQQIYLRALQTLPGCTIHRGTFIKKPRERALVHPKPGGPQTAWVWHVEEKGSDVNLATYLLLDAFDRDCDVAIVISNDSDLTEPIRIIRDRFGVKTIVVNPELPEKRRQESRNRKRGKPQISALLGAATEVRRIRVGVLRASPFPDEMEDNDGAFHKPQEWYFHSALG